MHRNLPTHNVLTPSTITWTRTAVWRRFQDVHQMNTNFLSLGYQNGAYVNRSLSLDLSNFSNQFLIEIATTSQISSLFCFLGLLHKSPETTNSCMTETCADQYLANKSYYLHALSTGGKESPKTQAGLENRQRGLYYKQEKEGSWLGIGTNVSVTSM